jgi:general L-amino acid transport system substrate-binding protein
VAFEKNEEVLKAYTEGRCDAFTTDQSGLYAERLQFADPAAHVVLPEIISKEPLGPVVRQGDDQWADIVRWTLNALVAAEDYGVTSQNIEEMMGSQDAEVKRLLGVEGDLGLMLGLDAAWAKNAIMAGGNYGELFAASIGEGTASNIARGLNAQWKDGGLQYSPPFR